MTAFDTLLNAFVTVVSAGPALSANIYADRDVSDDALPEGQATALVLNLSDADPQPVGGIAGNPVDWTTTVVITCLARVHGSSARGAVNTLASAVYARIAANPALGTGPGSGVFAGEPRIDWQFERAAARFAAATLTYTVQHRTTSLTLE